MWQERLDALSVVRQAPPFSLAPVPPSLPAQVEEAQRDLTLTFPADYVAFCQEVGAGTLSRCRIFCPSNMLAMADLRFHTLRLVDKFSRSDFNCLHKFPMRELVVFAKDTREALWFGWKKSECTHVYCFSEEETAPPPTKVSSSFSEFVMEFALGCGLKERGLRSIRPHGDAGPSDGEDSDSSSEDETEEVVLEGAEAQRVLCRRVFIPFATPPQ